MEIGSQIKKYRGAQRLSQDALAEKIFVTRQTISNWETGKSYPDVHSLLLLGAVFDVSLDQLVKGDIETMKKEIGKAEVTEFNRFGKIFSALFILSLLAFIPLFVFLKTTGLIIWAVLYLITLGFGVRVEKLKKANDLHTYREIVAFSEGKCLDEIQTQREIGKRPYQAVLKPLAGAAAGLIAAVIAGFLIKLLN